MRPNLRVTAHMRFSRDSRQFIAAWSKPAPCRIGLSLEFCMICSRRGARPFHFWDLASGDASCSGGGLRDTNLSDYTSVDLSEPALALASINDGGFRTFGHLYTDPLCFYGAFRAGG